MTEGDTESKVAKSRKVGAKSDVRSLGLEIRQAGRPSVVEGSSGQRVRAREMAMEAGSVSDSLALTGSRARLRRATNETNVSTLGDAHLP